MAAARDAHGQHIGVGLAAARDGEGFPQGETVVGYSDHRALWRGRGEKKSGAAGQQFLLGLQKLLASAGATL